MLEMVKKLEKKHVTPTREMTVISAKCLSCNMVMDILEQSFQKHNRLGRKHCQHCLPDSFHYLTNTRIWRIWMGIKTRVEDTSDKNYGGRGIEMCPEWKDFRVFYADMLEGYSDDLTIERIDVNGPYSKWNCKWVTMFAQQANKRTTRYLTYQGAKMHLAEIRRVSGVSKTKLTIRLNSGMTADEAVADARASTYGTGRHAKKGRMSTTLLTAVPVTDSL